MSNLDPGVVCPACDFAGQKKHPEKTQGAGRSEANSLLLDSRWFLLILPLLLFWRLRSRLLPLGRGCRPLRLRRRRVLWLLLRTLTRRRRRLLARRRLVPGWLWCGPIIFGSSRFRAVTRLSRRRPIFRRCEAVVWLRGGRAMLRRHGTIVRLRRGRTVCLRWPIAWLIRCRGPIVGLGGVGLSR